MSRRRRLGTVLGVVLAMFVAISAVGAGWLYVTLHSLGESLGQGFLGPTEERQRIEMPDRRFAISFAGDWVVDTDADRVVTGRSDVDSVLVAGPDGGVLRCRVDLVADGRSLDAESFLLAWAADDASADEHDTTVASGLPEVGVGVAVHGMDDRRVAAYWVPLEDDALILSCGIDGANARPRSDDDDDYLSWDARAMLFWGMPSIVRSIEPLAGPAVEPTPGPPGQAHRFETPSGIALTLAPLESIVALTTLPAHRLRARVGPGHLSRTASRPHGAARLPR